MFQFRTTWDAEECSRWLLAVTERDAMRRHDRAPLQLPVQVRGLRDRRARALREGWPRVARREVPRWRLGAGSRSVSEPARLERLFVLVEPRRDECWRSNRSWFVRGSIRKRR